MYTWLGLCRGLGCEVRATSASHVLGLASGRLVDAKFFDGSESRLRALRCERLALPMRGLRTVTRMKTSSTTAWNGMRTCNHPRPGFCAMRKGVARLRCVEWTECRGAATTHEKDCRLWLRAERQQSNVGRLALRICVE